MNILFKLGGEGIQSNVLWKLGWVALDPDGKVWAAAEALEQGEEGRWYVPEDVSIRCLGQFERTPTAEQVNSSLTQLDHAKDKGTLISFDVVISDTVSSDPKTWSSFLFKEVNFKSSWISGLISGWNSVGTVVSEVTLPDGSIQLLITYYDTKKKRTVFIERKARNVRIFD